MAADNTRRQLARQLLAGILDGDAALAHNTELALFVAAIQAATRACTYRHWDNPQFAQLYSFMARSAIFNLKHKDNTQLKQRLMQGAITPQQLAGMTAAEKFPARWVGRKASDAGPVQPPVAHEGGLKCSRCKSTRTSYVLLQTRSADESMTAYVTCHNCLKRWKM